MRWIAIFVCILMAGARAAAEERPVLQLDTGGHMALIQQHRVYAGRQAARLGLRRQDHPRVGSGERQDRAHDQGRERAGRCGQGLRHGAVAGRQMAGGGGVDDRVRRTAAGQHIRLYEFASGKLVALLKGHANVVYGLAFSPDGSRLISGSGDSTAILWDTGIRAGARVAEPKLLHRLEGHKDFDLRRWLQPRWQPRGDGLLRP